MKLTNFHGILVERTQSVVRVFISVLQLRTYRTYTACGRQIRFTSMRTIRHHNFLLFHGAFHYPMNEQAFRVTYNSQSHIIPYASSSFFPTIPRTSPLLRQQICSSRSCAAALFSRDRFCERDGPANVYHRLVDGDAHNRAILDQWSLWPSRYTRQRAYIRSLSAFLWLSDSPPCSTSSLPLLVGRFSHIISLSPLSLFPSLPSFLPDCVSLFLWYMLCDEACSIFI